MKIILSCVCFIFAMCLIGCKNNCENGVCPIEKCCCEDKCATEGCDKDCKCCAGKCECKKCTCKCCG